jgi:TetR/AcrR family transcriptional repressor of nem operon
MGRHALVDRDTALDRIMWQFWRTGYEASSIEDLLEASGLQRQSFYRAFGDKYRAFKLALERYTEQGTSGFLEPAVAGGDSPSRRLLRLLYLRLDVALGETPGANETTGDRPGCLLVNTAIEVAPHDPEIHSIVDAGLSTMRKAIAALVHEAASGREIKHSIDTDFVSYQLFALVQGMNVLARAGEKRSDLRRLVRQTVNNALGISLT